MPDGARRRGRRAALLLAGTLLIGLGGCSRQQAPAAPPALPAADVVQARAADPRPNVILIVADDLGWGDLGAYGNPRVKTPNLDRLAREGRLLTDASMAAAVCSPSRAAILSGRFPAELGIHAAMGGESDARLNTARWLDPHLPNLYSAFRALGYRTGHFGKWHLGSGKAPAPGAYGLDESATTNSTGPRLEVGGQALYEGTLDAAQGGKPAIARAKSSAVIADAAMGFIARNAARPFVLGLWTIEPHAVVDPDEGQMAAYADRTDPAVAGRFTNAEAVYFASVSSVDRQVGRVMDYLRRSGLDRHTLVIFTSDNGPAPGGARATGHAASDLSRGPFRGSKASLYEGGIRVPMLVSWPGRVPAGSVGRQSVSAVDLLPSLIALAGGAAPQGLNGEDRGADLLGTGPARPRSGALFWEIRQANWGPAIDASPRLALREGDWKLLADADGSRAELYNLAQSPDETANRAASEPARTAAMKTRLLDWHRTRVPPHGQDAPGGPAWRWPGR